MCLTFSSVFADFDINLLHIIYNIYIYIYICIYIYIYKGERWCSGQHGDLLSERFRVQFPSWKEFIFCSSALSLGSLSPSPLWGRLNEYQSWTGKVTAGLWESVWSTAHNTGMFTSLPAQDHLERR